ncbi:tRNA lysidine(34) synthetase TilS [Dyadobacter sp. CY312]|uniref:tRNA lysidine(34) synthetase TilS n=1 Tax=Dyadobacter sp. CY312 TaxID=2907303 RepID=UPI001F1D033D|nr:tRNA lysidine(34) synthetase TilS [Dyadobacter sp. CY312]MCE7040978.1 tRNA lysidine(34) synthetase TilS [Dyadobacter sp. CY312]
MLDSFLTFINQLGLDLGKQSTLLTISGGVDSVVMAHLFHRAGFGAAVAHCNFGLRGEESIEDELFVERLAGEYGYTFSVSHFETKKYAKEKGISTQMAARELRYSWFEELRKDRFDWIATAHHANDSLETVLLNFARGTGVAGLYGISPINGFVLRPLLFATKKEILDYAQSNQLLWREDRSNDSLDYKRNVIRKKVIPVLTELNPSLESTFQVTSEKVSAAATLLNGFLHDWQKEVVTDAVGEISIPISKLKEKEESAYLLWYVIENYGFNYTQAKQIADNLDSVSGLSFYSASHQILKSRAHLIVRKKNDEIKDTELHINGPGDYRFGNQSFFLEKCEDFEFSKEEKNVLYVDALSVVFPLKIRNWRHGDVFQPFGMKGLRKKVSDVLIDLKFSMYQKENVVVVTDHSDEIMWLVGIRTDERWRIATGAKGFYRMGFLPDKEC